MIRSMTGFARVSGALSDRFHLTIAVKSVNHRYLDTSVRLPESLWELEPVIRSVVGESLQRGKVDVTVRVQRTSEPEYAVQVNSNIASAVIPQMRNLMSKLSITGGLSAGDLLRIPDLIRVEAEESELSPEEHQKLRDLLRQVLEGLAAMRETEGRALHGDIATRLTTIEQLVSHVEEQREQITTELAAQFRARVEEIARSVESLVSEDRIAQELVMMAEKADVAEELTRLRIHLGEIRKLIDSAEPSGKKLDFLAQEVLREINTLGQKSRSATIRGTVIELKTEVERIREQVQNVE